MGSVSEMYVSFKNQDVQREGQIVCLVVHCLSDILNKTTPRALVPEFDSSARNPELKLHFYRPLYRSVIGMLRTSTHPQQQVHVSKNWASALSHASW